MRPPRIDEPGSYHHITNRGRNQQPVFVDGVDRECMLEHVSFAASACGIEVHAYALMDNHYHAIVRSLEGRLSEAMQIVGGRYTQDFNARHATDGALFKGRFFSRLIDSEGYVIEGVRYVINNPVKAGLVARPEDYVWSSYPATVGLVACPSFLDGRAIVNEYFGGDLALFDAFVRRSDTERGALFAHLADGPNSELTLAAARQRIRSSVDRLEALTPRNAQMETAHTALTHYVCNTFGVRMFEIADPRTERARDARVALLFLLREHDVAEPADLAEAFKMSLGGVRTLARRCRQRAERDTWFRDVLARGASVVSKAA